MQVFYHHIYEYQKGLRNLVLCTLKIENTSKICMRLNKENIPFVIHKIDDQKINVYFGHRHCIDVVKSFGTHRLDKITEEQDFILGIMLGYDRLQQCERYLGRHCSKQKLEQLAG